jgi:hypothetical protein
MFLEGPLRKMPTAAGEPVRYWLPLGEDRVELTALLGQPLRLRFLGRITCIACGRNTKKSFAQGHCFPCMRKLPQTDSCMVRPETCHFAKGTCRDEAWGREHCFQPHTVYLANSSGLKVGITRGEDPVTRWIDQGASQGLAIRQVEDRLEAGRVEVTLKDHVHDKTNWRAMLRGEPEPVDLRAARDQLLAEADIPGTPLPAAEVTHLRYPVLRYPDKVRSHNFERDETLAGVLHGIKGQYLMVGERVLNVRNWAGHHVELALE